jgi:hypothetical protein
MCLAVCYCDATADVNIHFSNHKAVLPVLIKTGGVRWLPWGRRRQDPGQLPMGGWARLDRLQSGNWDAYFPRPVKIPVKAFMEKDFEGANGWYPLVKGQVLQGVVARYRLEYRVYIVTIVPEREQSLYDRWPRVLTTL